MAKNMRRHPKKLTGKMMYKYLFYCKIGRKKNMDGNLDKMGNIYSKPVTQTYEAQATPKTTKTSTVITPI
jgi:hypothetical protein